MFVILLQLSSGAWRARRHRLHYFRIGHGGPSPETNRSEAKQSVDFGSSRHGAAFAINSRGGRLSTHRDRTAPWDHFSDRGGAWSLIARLRKDGRGAEKTQ